MLGSVDVVCADVWCSAYEVNVYWSWRSGFRVVGFLAVVSVWRFAFGLVDSYESDVSCFEQAVEVGSAESSVVGVCGEAWQTLGCLEVLVDDDVAFGGSVGGDRVDGEDYLFVSFGSADVGEGVGESGNDGAASGGVQSDVGVVASVSDLSGGLVYDSGLFGKDLASGGH